jgi:hypothetical protein
MFLTCIMSFIWLSGSSQDQVDFAVSPRAALGPRIGLTVVFSLGMIYFILIVRTFHRYGDPLDREWMRTVNQWTKEAMEYPYQNQPNRPVYPSPSWVRRSISPQKPRSSTPRSSRHPSPTRVVVPSSFLAGDGFTKVPPSHPLTTRPSAFFNTPRPSSTSPEPSLPIDPVTVMQLGYPDVQARTTAYANLGSAQAVTASDWSRFLLVRFPRS